MTTEEKKEMYEIKVSKYLADTFSSIADLKQLSDRQQLIEAWYVYTLLHLPEDDSGPTKPEFCELLMSNEKYYDFLLRCLCTFYMQSEIPVNPETILVSDENEIREALEIKNSVIARTVEQFDLSTLERYATYAFSKAADDLLAA